MCTHQLFFEMAYPLHPTHCPRYLRFNNLTGGLPPGWGDPEALPSLRYLHVSDNPLGGEQCSGGVCAS